MLWAGQNPGPWPRSDQPRCRGDAADFVMPPQPARLCCVRGFEVGSDPEPLDFLPKFFPRIFRVQLGQFPQQFLGALVSRHGHGYRDFDDLIAPDSLLGGRGNALLAKAQLLSRLRPRRNLQQRPPIDGWNLDLGAQRGLRGADRDGKVDVVPIAPEDGMITGADDHVQVAGRAGVRPAVALAGGPDALPVARTSLYADFDRLGSGDRAFAVADRAGGNVFPRPMAARARYIKLHASARLRNLPRAVAFRTLSRRFNVTLPVAIRAYILARNVQPHHAAAYRRPEGHVDLIFKIGTLFGSS